jgi:hypothetical protein
MYDENCVLLKCVSIVSRVKEGDDPTLSWSFRVASFEVSLSICPVTTFERLVCFILCNAVILVCLNEGL